LQAGLENFLTIVKRLFNLGELNNGVEVCIIPSSIAGLKGEKYLS